MRGVIFDLDGTLVDSTPAIVRSWTTWAGDFGVTAEQLAGFHGVPSGDVVRRLIAAKRHREAIARIDELELSDVEDIVILPGAAEALRALATAPTAIATSANRLLAKARIKAAGLVPPTVIVTVDDVTHGKPAPDIFLEAARRLGLDAADCLVVEDAPMGLQAARAAGCATLAVATTNPADVLDADQVVPDLSHVEFVVENGLISMRSSSD